MTADKWLDFVRQGVDMSVNKFGSACMQHEKHVQQSKKVLAACAQLHRDMDVQVPLAPLDLQPSTS
jgi:hypothetical protein